MQASKTTFYLSNELRARLKSLAAHSGKSVKDLLTEGAELVLARHQTRLDREELRRRAARAWERLRDGLYSGVPMVNEADQLVYSARRSRRTKK